MRAEPKLDTMQTVEVAEGVDIYLRPAGPIPRAFAYAIDLLLRWLIVAAVMLIGSLSISFLGIGAGEFGVGMFLLLLFVIEWGYYVICEKVWGRTPGKRAMGLSVVRTSGVPLSWPAAILRNLLRSVDGLPWISIGAQPLFPLALVGLGTALFTKKFQRMGDLLADTVVIYSGKTIEAALPVLNTAQNQITPLPPAVALSREEQQAMLLFLERAGLWSEGRKMELADHLKTLTGTTGHAGVIQLLRMALWLRDSAP